MNRGKSVPFVDYPLLSVILMLMGISLILLYSAGGENMDQLAKHGIRAGFALLLMLVVSRVPPGILSRYSLHIYLSGLALLVVVLAVGFIGKGAQRWIDLGFMRIQPSELMKISLVMVLAARGRHHRRSRDCGESGRSAASWTHRCPCKRRR